MADDAASVEPGGPKWRRRIPRSWLWALLGVAAVVILVFVLQVGPWLFTRAPDYGLNAEQELKAENDVRTTLVQAVAGLAVATGAIVTYRTFRQNQLDQVNRHDREERTYKLHQSQQVTDTYTKAVEQLGHDGAPVRLGALYSLVSLAQDNPARRQTVVDVLCAYLRMPYAPLTQVESAPPQQEESAIASVATTGSSSPTDSAGAKGERDAAQELQVRQTAQRLLGEHLRCPPEIPKQEAQSIAATPDNTFWPGISLHLTGATLVDLDLRDISVSHAEFIKSRFVGNARFENATFGVAGFFGATFDGTADFLMATFGNASFFQAKFSGGAAFGGATFGRATFIRATFAAFSGFSQATFTDNVEFSEAMFSGESWFTRATFASRADFGRKSFVGFSLGEEMAKSLQSWKLSGATFSDIAQFEGASGRMDFEGVHVLHLDDQSLNKADGFRRRVWPEGWTVQLDADDPTRGTLVPVESSTGDG